MSKVIVLFNHKGGVSKTTTTFNLGWMLSQKQKRVMIVDADPQCNLTGTVIGLDESEKFYEDGLGKAANIYKLLEPCIIKGRGQSVPDIPLHQTPKNDNLFLLAGSQELIEVDPITSVALKTSTSLQNMLNFPGFIGNAIRETARKNFIDIVLIDMSPSIGALNQCILMNSDYFIVPTSPDFYCYQAINSLTKKIPEWDEEMEKFRKPNIDVQVQESKTKFIGIISQRYRPRQNAAIPGKDTTKAFQNWIDKINTRVVKNLVPSLQKRDMCITEEQFKKSFTDETPFNTVSIPEFNALIARSQDVSLPIYALTKQELLSSGIAQQNQLENVKKFQDIFSTFADGVLQVVS